MLIPANMQKLKEFRRPDLNRNLAGVCLLHCPSQCRLTTISLWHQQREHGRKSVGGGVQRSYAKVELVFPPGVAPVFM